MTISNQTILRNDYIANGTNTIFAFNFPIFYEPSEAIKFSIQVIITNEIGVETIKTENSDYTITYNASNIDNNVINQGNVVFTTAPANLYRVSLLRKVNLTQNTNLTNKGTDKFSGANVEASLDKLTLINLENKEIFNRCVLLPKSTNLSSIELPIKVENANKVITVNSAGNNLEVRTFLDKNLLPVSPFMETILVKETANEARQSLGVNAATKITAGILPIINSPIIFGINAIDPNNDVDFFRNSFYFHDNSGFATLTSDLTKRLDANWVAGNNQGGLDTGTKQTNTPYYGYAIYNPTTLVADIIFSANPTSPTLPSGFTKYRRIKGAFFLTNASGNIRGFYYIPDSGHYLWHTPITVHFSQNTSGSQNNDVSVPRIFGMVAFVQVQGLNDAVNAYSFTTISSGGMTIDSGGADNGSSMNNGELPILNNTSTASITWGGAAARRNYIYTYGFIDTTHY